MSPTLRSIAQDFLSTFHVLKAIGSFVEVYFTGSYTLDTMTWPDIDLQIKLGPQAPAPLHVLSDLMTTLLMDTRVAKVDFRNFKDHPKPGMSRGYCLCASVYDENLKPFSHGLYWKVDCWILEDRDFQQNCLFMQKLKDQMTSAHKDLIMQYKNDWTCTYGRPPQMASYFLYQAVVFAGLKKEGEILAYLRDKGVKI